MATRCGSRRIHLNLADNLCDPARTASCACRHWAIPPARRSRSNTPSARTVSWSWRWIKDGPPIPLFAKYGNFRSNVDRWHYYDYVAPCSAVIDFGSADAHTIGNPEDRDRGLRDLRLPVSSRRSMITPASTTGCISAQFRRRRRRRRPAPACGFPHRLQRGQGDLGADRGGGACETQCQAYPARYRRRAAAHADALSSAWWPVTPKRRLRKP